MTLINSINSGNSGERKSFKVFDSVKEVVKEKLWCLRNRYLKKCPSEFIYNRLLFLSCKSCPYKNVEEKEGIDLLFNKYALFACEFSCLLKIHAEINELVLHELDREERAILEKIILQRNNILKYSSKVQPYFNFESIEVDSLVSYLQSQIDSLKGSNDFCVNEEGNSFFCIPGFAKNHLCFFIFEWNREDDNYSFKICNTGLGSKDKELHGEFLLYVGNRCAGKVIAQIDNLGLEDLKDKDFLRSLVSCSETIESFYTSIKSFLLNGESKKCCGIVRSSSFEEKMKYFNQSSQEVIAQIAELESGVELGMWNQNLNMNKKKKAL